MAHLTEPQFRPTVFSVTSELQIRNHDGTPAAQITIDEARRAHTYLREQPFSIAMYVLGLETNPVRARLIRMSEKTVANALNGAPISGEFIANLLLRLTPHAEHLARVRLDVTFDTFFEVREEQS